jgi:hypothetical protein
MLLHPRSGHEYGIASPRTLGPFVSISGHFGPLAFGISKSRMLLKARSQKPKAPCHELSSLWLLGASGFWTFQKLAVQELKQIGPYLPRRLEGGQSSGGKGPQNLA